MNDHLSKIYEIRFSGFEKYRNQVWKILVSQFFSKWIYSNAQILDLGCGYGEFINNIDSVKKDSILLSSPHYVISVKDRIGRINKITTYYKPNEEFVNDEGEILAYDPDHEYKFCYQLLWRIHRIAKLIHDMWLFGSYRTAL